MLPAAQEAPDSLRTRKQNTRAMLREDRDLGPAEAGLAQYRTKRPGRGIPGGRSFRWLRHRNRGYRVPRHRLSSTPALHTMKAC